MLINIERIFKFNIILERENLEAAMSEPEVHFSSLFSPYPHFFFFFDLVHKNSSPHSGSFLAHSKEVGCSTSLYLKDKK